MYAHGYLTAENIIMKTKRQLVKGGKGDSLINYMIRTLGKRINFCAKAEQTVIRSCYKSSILFQKISKRIWSKWFLYK